MKLTDIIELAKQGYKPADIRELLKIETETGPKSEPDPEPEPEAQTDPETEPEAQTDPETEPEAQTDPEPEPDYKQLYEEEKAKRQAAARKQEVAKDNTKSVEDTLLDIAKMYI